MIKGKLLRVLNISLELSLIDGECKQTPTLNMAHYKGKSMYIYYINECLCSF